MASLYGDLDKHCQLVLCAYSTNLVLRNNEPINDQRMLFVTCKQMVVLKRCVTCVTFYERKSLLASLSGLSPQAWVGKARSYQLPLVPLQDDGNLPPGYRPAMDDFLSEDAQFV